jgi:hypothetical protein
MYTQVDFGRELKERVKNKEDVAEIGAWAFEVYLDYTYVKNSGFLDVLLALNKMEIDPGFALSYKRLNEIADDLIAGKKNINLDY